MFVCTAKLDHENAHGNVAVKAYNNISTCLLAAVVFFIISLSIGECRILRKQINFWFQTRLGRDYWVVLIIRYTVHDTSMFHSWLILLFEEDEK